MKFPTWLRGIINSIKFAFFGKPTQEPSIKQSSSTMSFQDTTKTTAKIKSTTHQKDSKNVGLYEGNEILLRDLRQNASKFHYLLDTTYFWYSNQNQGTTRETSTTLVNKWNYILHANYCEALLKKFEAIQKSTNSDEQIVRTWFDFLKTLELTQFASQEEKLTLTPDNRGYFENGRLFDDGTILFINRHPWLLKGELLLRGEFYEEK